MEIRHATKEDLSRILEIYEQARIRMRECGNPNQWGSTYPTEALIQEDFERGQLYLCTDGMQICAVFVYFEGEEPTYQRITNGAWKNPLTVGVVHRMAVSLPGRGVAGFCLDDCFRQSKNIKIDTHRDNLPMRRTLEKNGFFACGTIFLENGEERIAYQRC